MKDGEVVDVVDKAEADVEAIQHKMVGREIDRRYYREHKQEPYKDDEPLVVAEGLSRTGEFEDVTFTLHRGEVLTLVGTEGSGTESVMRTLFGLERPDGGRLAVRGTPVREFSPAAAVARGVGYVPRERKVEGIVGGMSVAENITLSQLGAYSRGGVIASSREHQTARDWVKRLSIKAPNVDAQCVNLSGGNQQKVVLSKWRSAGSDIILLDHPTRGLDIGAKEDVYEMIRAMCANHCGVLLVADTLEEAIGLSHTILVMKDGRVEERFDCAPGRKPTLYDLVHHMT